MISNVAWKIKILEEPNEASHDIKINCNPSKRTDLTTWFSIDFMKSHIKADSVKVEVDGLSLGYPQTRQFLGDNYLRVDLDKLNEGFPSLNLYQRNNFELSCGFNTYPIFKQDGHGGKFVDVPFKSTFRSSQVILEFILPRACKFWQRVLLEIWSKLTNELLLPIPYGNEELPQIVPEKDQIRIIYQLKSDVTPTFGFRFQELKIRGPLIVGIIASLLAAVIFYLLGLSLLKLMEMIR